MANVILVSSDMQFRDKIDPMLEESGHSVLQAECPETATELMNQKPDWVEVILCDGEFNFKDRINMANATWKTKDVRMIVMSPERTMDIITGYKDAMVSKNHPSTIVQYIDKLAP